LETLNNQVWVERVSGVIMASMRGDVTKAMLCQRHEQILQIANDTSSRKLLLNDLEMHPMSYEMLEAQKVFNKQLEALHFKIAIVVPDSRLAYLARLQFNGAGQRIFYTDTAKAIEWLNY
jgi:phosphoribosylaminoimidazole carboxylase (NCAIR synthetase)